MIRPSIAQEPRLRNECPLGILLQQEIRPRLVLRIAMCGQRDIADRAAERVHRCGIEIGLDCDLFSGGNGGWRGRRHRRRRGFPGRWNFGAGLRSCRRRRDLWHRRSVLALPRLPEKKRGKRENDKQNDALGVHQTNIGFLGTAYQGTGS